MSRASSVSLTEVRVKRGLFWLVLAVLIHGCGGSIDNGETASGGSAGNGGSAGVGGSAGGMGTGGGRSPECRDPGQCRLYSDCCTCVALGPDDPAPEPCPVDCALDQCTELGVTRAVCAGGECSAGFDCTGRVTCPAAPVVCGQGQVPSVVRGCWGPCVPFEQCGFVQDCGQCRAAGRACVTFGGSFTEATACAPIPESCGSKPSCACMDDLVCATNFPCSDRSDGAGIVCNCLTC